MTAHDGRHLGLYAAAIRTYGLRMRPRLSPSLVVAVLALVVAAGGTGFAAGKITSKDIKNGTIQAKDVRDGTLTGAEVKDGSLNGADLGQRSVPRDRIAVTCGAGQVPFFDGCTTRAAVPHSAACVADGAPVQQCFTEAWEDCAKRHGRLPTIGELRYIARTDGFVWADNGNPSEYEFSGDYTAEYPLTPMAVDQFGFLVSNASAQAFPHRCITH